MSLLFIPLITLVVLMGVFYVIAEIEESRND